MKQLRAIHPEAKIYFQTILPRESDTLASVESVNNQVKALTALYDVAWIDLTDDFAAPDGTLKPALTYDGLHLNDAGYALWAQRLKPYLD